MKNLWKGALALALFGVASAPMTSGCAQPEGMLYIKNVKAQRCEDISVDSPFLGSGRMDIRYSCNYIAILELNNQLVRRGDETKLQIETSRISVTGVDVQILSADGAVVGQFTYPMSGFVDPATGTNPGRGLASALLIDGGTAAAVGAQIGPGGSGLYIANVVARGRTLGGLDIESRPFEFPIEICDGCLCYEPSDDTCVGSTGAPDDDCFFPQDFGFDCRWIGQSCSAPATCGSF